jgi:hypothetical protein
MPRTHNSCLRIVVTGLIAQHRRLGGVAWDYAQYPAGLARLGHDVYYLEDSGEWPYTVDGGPFRENWIAFDCTPNIEHLDAVMKRFGLAGRWMYRFPVKPRWFGLPHRKRREILASADLVINVSGTLKRPQDYGGAARLVYIDSDPVFTQVKLNQPRGQIKFQRRVAAHDVYFSFGERLEAAVPPTPQEWKPTRQPILLDEWRPRAPRRDVFTTVMSWTSYKPLRYARRAFAQKDVEFKRFLELPMAVRPTRLEVALAKTQHVNWQHNGTPLPSRVAALMAGQRNWTPQELLRRTGWRTVDAASACPDLERYRRYIESSKGEWSVAKHGYVVGRPGWFSCRSACYLAAGRPVVVQDTGFAGILPVGEGVLVFSTLDEAVAAIREVEADYTRHARAARAIAEEYFASDVVLSRLVEEAMA